MACLSLACTGASSSQPVHSGGIDLADPTSVEPLDAGIDAAPVRRPAEAPLIECDAGTVLARSPPPIGREIFCARLDGTRHGEYLRYHDATTVAERGRYADGAKDGRWEQHSRAGALLGVYTIDRGTGVERRWHDAGGLASEHALREGVRHGEARRFALDGTLMITERYVDGALEGPRVVGAPETMRIEETYLAGALHGTRKVWRNKRLFLEERYRHGVLHGPWKAYRSYGRLREVGNYDNGLEDGMWVSYHSSGRPSRKGSYARGKKQGVWTAFSTAGAPIYFGPYVDDRKHGVWSQNDPSGKLLGTYEMNDGTGTEREWHRPGVLAAESEYQRGVRHGRFESFHFRTGRRHELGAFRDGARHGRWRAWHGNGALALDGAYHAGERHGVFKELDEHGVVLEETTYQEGARHGPAIERYADGTTELEGSYVEDERDGVWVQYHPGGAVAVKARWSGGTLHGPYVAYYPNGTHEAAGAYARGKRTGRWRFWSPDGGLLPAGPPSGERDQ
ncbi:MAG TPA: hypothetical protein VML75_19225 [Kofleriaceae bacterium]|nr:hypothetical protein [Kofleriaceae bacterium]